MAKASTGGRRSSEPPEPSGGSSVEAADGALWSTLLGLAGDANVALASEKVRAFRTFLLLYGAARTWLWIHFLTIPAPLLALSAIGMTVCAVLGATRRWGHLGARIGLPLVLYQVWFTFPDTANHNFLELYCLIAVCLADRKHVAADQLVVQALQWLTAIVLFHTGLQKFLYGYYFGGEFLAYMVGAQERFANLFQLILSSDEVARLQGYDPMRREAGPFRVESVLFIVASNVVWIAELILPFLMIHRRTRILGAAGALALVFAIEVGALELGFAILFVNLLLLFFPGSWNRRLLPAFALLLIWAVAASFGLAPGGAWIRASYL